MLAQIRSFITVVEEGSLHRAAARLRISPSALSRQMQALEHELGGRLLERMTTGVSPTTGGQELAKRMGALLASYDLAMSDTRRALRGETDQVRIGYLPSAAKQYLSGPLREVRRSHPKTVLKVVNLSPGEQIIALRAGEIDIGITTESGELLAGEFTRESWQRWESYIALPEHHRLATQDRVRLSDLKGEFFVSSDSQQVPGLGPAGRGVLQKVREVSPENFMDRRKGLHRPTPLPNHPIRSSSTIGQSRSKLNALEPIFGILRDSLQDEIDRFEECERQLEADREQRLDK